MEDEKLRKTTTIRLSFTEHEDITKISRDNMDTSVSSTIRRLVKKEIKRVRNKLKGEKYE